jgi:hypothetical protein
MRKYSFFLSKFFFLSHLSAFYLNSIEKIAISVS